MNNLEEIRDEILMKGFPELMGSDIHINYAELEDSFLECGEYAGEGYYIEVDEALKDAPKEVLEGGIAHELAHLIRDIKRKTTEKIFDEIMYKISSRYRMMDERNTDMTVLMRGYGKQFLKLKEYEQKIGYNHFSDDGLTISEVKALLNHK